MAAKMHKRLKNTGASRCFEPTFDFTRRLKIESFVRAVRAVFSCGAARTE